MELKISASRMIDLSERCLTTKLLIRLCPGAFFDWEIADDVLYFTWASMLSREGHRKRGLKKSSNIESMSFIWVDIMWFKNVGFIGVRGGPQIVRHTEWRGW